MTKAKVVLHVEKLAHLFAVREAERRDPLFSKGIAVFLKACHYALREAIRSQDEAKFLKVANKNLYRAFEKVGSEKSSHEVNESCLNLRAVIGELKGLANLGAGGIFRDQDFKLTVLLSEVTDVLERKERLLNQILSP